MSTVILICQAVILFLIILGSWNVRRATRIWMNLWQHQQGINDGILERLKRLEEKE